jgi:cellobiose phosphorylase
MRATQGPQCSSQGRRLSVTGYWEWVLGEIRAKNAMHVVTEFDARAGAVFARNSYNTDFSGRCAFVTCSEGVTSVDV